MAGMIFISYRRDDSAPYAARLCDLMGAMLGTDDFFFDIDTIHPGRDFREVIQDALSSCKVLLAVIGRQWATLRDESGKLRLDSETDYVRIEVASALQKGLSVIPVLVGGATMPDESSLPPDLRPLVYRHNWILSDRHFRKDVQILVDVLKDLLPKTPSLFPLYGVTLGKTTEIELARVATKKYEGRYEYNGINFFIVDGVFTYLCLWHWDKFPAQWEKEGVRSQNSYDEWLSILEAFGYAVTVVRPPTLERKFSYDSVRARVFGRKETPCPHLLELNFGDKPGDSRRAPSTLYTLEIRQMESSEIDEKLASELEKSKLYHFGYGLYGLGPELI
jgi:hypothetical protein